MVLFCDTEIANTLTGDGGKIVADHVSAAIAFTARSVDGNEISTRRLAIIIAADGESIEDRELYTPEMVDVLLEQFFLMMANVAGPDTMIQVMENRHQMAMESMVDDAMDDIGLRHENLN
jgi:hypothetical protein